MTNAHIIALMDGYLSRARELAANGDLDDHMTGYLRGCVATLALVAARTDIFSLAHTYESQISALRVPA